MSVHKKTASCLFSESMGFKKIIAKALPDPLIKKYPANYEKPGKNQYN
jgi:hypothetical protein